MGKVVVEVKKKAKGRKVAQIRIVPGEKKSVVVHHREHGAPPSAKEMLMGMRSGGMGPEKQQAFSTPEDAQDHVNGLMGDMEPPAEGSGSMY